MAPFIQGLCELGSVCYIYAMVLSEEQLIFIVSYMPGVL